MTGPNQRLQRRRLRRALARLTRLQRDVFLAASRDGRPVSEIAGRMGIASAEAEQLLADALVRLSRELDADRRSIRTGSIRAGWTRFRRRLSARLRRGRGRS